MTTALDPSVDPMPAHPAVPPLSPLKAAALELYRAISQPRRRRLATAQAAAGRARVMVYFYHRVARSSNSPLTMPFATFRRQIDWLRQHVEMVSFEESLARIRGGNARPTAHITFDDGYAENCAHALPYLVSQGVPTTYFVSSWHIQTGAPFAHDVRLGKRFPVNTAQQIKALAEAGIEIGAHTRRHPDLGLITDEATLRDEIIGCKHDLEDMIGRPVRYFAFPFGTHRQLTSAAIRIAREAGYDAICSAVGGYNFPGDDPFHVQRIHGDTEMSRFRNWATMDPRKIHLRLNLPVDSTFQPDAADMAVAID